MSLYEKAAAKLEATYKDVKDKYGAAMKGAVRDALLDFARQDEEFAEAIADGGSFKDCMAAVCKGVGQSLSDLEAYSRAAAFYFPGCKVRFEMRIDLIGDAAAHEPLAPKEYPGIIIDLSAFL